MIEITINSDASYFNKQVAAYAYWIDTPDGKVGGAGLIEEQVDTPSMAELLSFRKAYEKVSELYPDQKLKIRVFCDNLWVVRGITGDYRKYDNTRNIHIATIKSVHRDLRDHEVESFHVKGHATKLTTPEQIANNWCDFHAREIARKEMRRTSYERSNNRTRQGTSDPKVQRIS